MNDEKAAQASPSAGSRTYKRKVRNVLIHKPMQREFTFVIITLLMVSSLAITFIIHRTITGALTEGGFRFGRVTPYEALSDVSYTLIVRVAAVLFVTLIIIGVFGIFFLHRVAGPAYRFRQVFLKINRGEIPHQFKLREGDFFVEVADEINRLLKRLEFERDKKQAVQAKLERILNSNPPEPIAQSAKEAKKLLEEHPQPSAD
jgi:hypothetical protein